MYRCTERREWAQDMTAEAEEERRGESRNTVQDLFHVPMMNKIRK